MQSVGRTLAVYLFLMLILRATGKRTMNQVTLFDFVLLLVLSETTQQALMGPDFSVMDCWIVVATFVFMDISLSLLKKRFPRLDRMLEGQPLIVVREGRLLREATDKCRITEDDVLLAARQSQGLERMDQVKWAVLEQDGSISIIPYPKH
jgi:uncharacterized membrane protein YcaP (DUF421 family)